MTDLTEVELGPLEALDDPGCREFTIGEGDWPFRGFVVRRGDEVFAYQNVCRHVGHPLNWTPDNFLDKDGKAIQCASHGALYAIDTGLCFAGPCRGKSLQAVEVKLRDGIVHVRAPAQH